MKTRLCLVLALMGFISCSTPQQTDNKVYTAFTGATIIDGTGAAPIQNGVLLVADGRIAAMGTKNEVTLPDNITVNDLSGKTIIPGLINAHGHVGDVKGIEGGHYSKQNVIDNLSLFARYGVTTVVSLGADKGEAVALRAVADTTATQRARLYMAGEVISGNTPEEAVAVVDQNDAMGVDFMKIRVDDNLGSSAKMTEEVYQAVINRSHELGYKIATHMYYLDDAKKLLRAGSDFLAHSVRDLPVDDELIGLLREKKVCYCPTLTRELSTYVYEDTAAFFSDPFFLRTYNTSVVEPLLDPARQAQIRNNPSAQTYKQQLPTAMANLKTLSDNGVTIAFGTDSGIPTRFIGYFEHLEMAMMADAGLSPMQIIVSATSDAAKCLDLKDVGKLVTGYWADFVVLDANPLEDIKNSKSISGVWIAGEEVK
ncbi:amidohydrolase family protein [Imperialibacter roseus]|uniref:Amidohydrolase family protein n=1 Tax=Imperialibacter roseus TaxID=1324217 RepID=A0ABZ0IT98_9BACT|nr:amidohydrolase family protein [Imperialibacter roseus]WOK08252.1 amidohydrolase family protein [Imperialibacter roseus]